jgi:hypothetical protein
MACQACFEKSLFMVDQCSPSLSSMAFSSLSEQISFSVSVEALAQSNALAGSVMQASTTPDKSKVRIIHRLMC